MKLQVSEMTRPIRALVLVAAIPVIVYGQKSTKATRSGLSERDHYHTRELVRRAGTRYLTTGKERLVLTGTLTTPGGSATPVRITYEQPGKFRYEDLANAANNIVFNGSSAAQSQKALTERDEDLVETLLQDSFEYFMAPSGTGFAQFLGNRFRDRDGSLYDVYRGPLSIGHKKQRTVREKLFLFDPSSAALSRVRYSASQSGRTVRIETVWEAWQSVQGERYPSTVRRLEDGNEVFSVRFSAAQVGPKSEDEYRIP